MSFGNFIDMYNLTHNLHIEHFHHPLKVTYTSFQQCFICPSPRQTLICFLSLKIIFFSFSVVHMNEILHQDLYLTCLAQQDLTEIHSYCCSYQDVYSFTLLSRIPLHVYIAICLHIQLTFEDYIFPNK